MKILIDKKIGNNSVRFEIEEKDPKESIAQSTFFMAPDYCGKCKKSNIIWTTNKAKTEDGTFTYVKRLCLECKATSTMGEYKTGGFYWRQWEIFIPKQQNEGGNKPEYPKNDLGEPGF